MLLKRFLQYSHQHKLFSPSGTILLAVSGGIDSVVMTDLFFRAKISCGIAHCNFTLRGEESDAEELFVEQLARKYNMPFFVKRFDTKAFAHQHHISVQEAARMLRYAWFEELRTQHHYQFIATAHHQDDNIETFFINLVRGTGIRGLTGIKVRQGNIIRPLLFCSRKEIEEYARENQLAYREDSSNQQTKYLRNQIRHLILPVFSTLRPGFRHTMEENMKRLEEAVAIIDEILKTKKKEIIEYKDNEMHLSIEKLKSCSCPSLLLYDILKEYGFSSGIIHEVLQSADSQSGRQFFSGKYRLIKDRESFILSPLPEEEENIRHYIDEVPAEIFSPLPLSFTIVPATDFSIPSHNNMAALDLDKLEFPLILRKWKAGDYFVPLGMKGIKKVSDFLIDCKVPVHKKENVWTLLSGEKIVWIVNYRIDDRYKITSETKNILLVELKK